MNTEASGEGKQEGGEKYAVEVAATGKGRYVIGGKQYEVQFADRPGAAMFEPQAILRGARADIRPDQTVRMTDSSGRSFSLNTVSVLEEANGRGLVQLLDGQFVIAELHFGGFEDAVGFMRGMAMVAAGVPPLCGICGQNLVAQAGDEMCPLCQGDLAAAEKRASGE